MAKTKISIKPKIAMTGNNNSAIGQRALHLNTTGSNNMAMGTTALRANTEGSNNVGVGVQALQSNTTGGNNIGIGLSACTFNETGNRNIGIGTEAVKVTTISDITGIGYRALFANTTGARNTSIGSQSLITNITGADCTAIGYKAGNLATGGGHVFLGANAGAQVTTETNNLYIANSNTTTPLIYGEFDNGLVKIHGDLYLPGDGFELFFGEGNDAKILYDGDSLNIDSSLVAASDIEVQCGTAKTIELQTVVWDDENIGAGTLSGPPGLQPGIVNFVDNIGADTGIATFGIAVGEGLSGFLEIPHKYKEGTDITFHVHWQGIAAPTGTDNVQWQLTYTLCGESATITLPPVTIITAETAFDTQYECMITSFTAITGTDFNIGDQFLFTIERITASANEYGGEGLIQTVGIHFQIDTIGSRQILTK